MSLRELPPEQSAPSTKTLWGRLHYVPLVVLLVCVLIATAVGLYVRERNDRLVAEAAAASAVPAALEPAQSVEPALPESCTQDVEPPAQEIWLEGDAAEAEAVWQANMADLENSPIVPGEDGYVDWNDVQANNFSQAVGRRTLTISEAEQWHTYLASMRDTLAAEGIPFVIAVTPSKWGVYPQGLPAWAQEIRGSGPLDQLLARYPDLPIMDLRQPLREASEDNPVFSRVNSHWTDYGAYLGWNAIAECLQTVTPEVGELSPIPIDGVETIADRNEFADYGISNTTPDWTVPDYAGPLRPVTATLADGTVQTTDGSVLTGLMTLPAETVTDGAQSSSSALILRDSFGDSLSVPFQQAFAKTWQVRHNLDDFVNRPDVTALVAEHKPDVVILQLAQRHLNFAPTSP